MKTNDLRSLIVSKLQNCGIESVYYENADLEEFPRVVFELSKSDVETARDDYILTIDLWDRSLSASVIEDLADSIEEEFRDVNQPNESLLPTFYFESQGMVEDEDKMIKHRVIKISCQSYERG